MSAALEEIIGTGAASAGTAVDYGAFSFSVKRWVLASLAEQAVSVVSASPGVPVLGCFRVRLSADGLELAATNMAQTILAASPAVSGPDGEHLAYIPARKLAAILKEAPEGDFTVAVKKDLATLTAGGGVHWTLRLPDGTHFPVLPDLSLTAFQPVPREKLLRALRTVRHTVGKDAGVPPQMQVSIAGAEPAGMAVTSIAGSRCTRAPVPGFPFPVTIPAGALDHLARLLSASPAEEAEAGLAEPGPVFRAGAVTLLANRMAAQFPDVDNLLLRPVQQNEETLAVDRDDLAQAVRRVRINASPDTSAIALCLSAKAVTVEARHVKDSATETVPASWTGADRVLTLNHACLLDALDVHPSKACVFRVGKDLGKRRSMVLLADAESGVTGVLSQMPPGVLGY